jgi:phosphomannomutase
VTGSGTRIASISGVRGLVGNGIDPAVAVEFAAAYATLCEPGPIVLSHDGRLSAPVLAAAVQAGVTGTGHDVFLAGATATPTVGLLVRELGCAGGIQISASHNPPEYNGLKFFQPAGMVLNHAQGRALLEGWQKRDIRWAQWDRLGRTRTIEDPDAVHLRRVIELVDAAAIRNRKLKVVLDACHGAGGRLGAALLRGLSCQAVILGGEPDGRYDHAPEPTSANLRQFAAIVPALGAAVGFAQDPDADRLAIIDENGRYIGEELTLALAALRRLEQARGPVVLNLSTSRVTEEIAGRLGCQVLRTAVGEINVVERMVADHAVLGGEGNGGVIDPRVGYVRDSFVAMALVLDLIVATGERLSSLVDRLPRYSMIKQQIPLEAQANSPCGLGQDGDADQSRQLWKRIAERYPRARADHRDGLRLDWDDRWVHLRASNTEPIIRVIAEAHEPGIAAEVAREIGGFVQGFQPEKAS